MGDVYTTGMWVPKAGEEEAFADAWLRFASWASTMPGAGTLRLARDLDDKSRYVSFGRWDDIEAVHRWKSDPQFRAHMSTVQQHVDEFAASELEIVRATSE